MNVKKNKQKYAVGNLCQPENILIKQSRCLSWSCEASEQKDQLRLD